MLADLELEQQDGIKHIHKLQSEIDGLQDIISKRSVLVQQEVQQFDILISKINTMRSNLEKDSASSPTLSTTITSVPSTTTPADFTADGLSLFIVKMVSLIQNMCSAPEGVPNALEQSVASVVQEIFATAAAPTSAGVAAAADSTVTPIIQSMDISQIPLVQVDCIPQNISAAISRGCGPLGSIRATGAENPFNLGADARSRGPGRERSNSTPPNITREQWDKKNGVA